MGYKYGDKQNRHQNLTFFPYIIIKELNNAPDFE